MSAEHQETLGAKALPAVLIVDDVEANLVVLRALLDGVECSVTSVNSGEQALRALLRQRFAVMLLDVQMPTMDGYEVARHVRMNPATRDVPIIFLTATLDSEANVTRGYDSGAVDFLFKPIDSAVLLSKVRIFLELYSARQTEARAAHELRQAHGELQVAYRELQATQTQLVQSAKMASLGELVAGVAHEINNPLAFVLSHLETTRRSLDAFRQDLPEPLPERAVDHWQKAETRLLEIEGGLGRIRDLVLKLRTFSRLDEGERKTVSVSDCIDSVLTILGHKLKDRATVVRQLSQPDELECYPSLLNQVLLNLVANAIDAIEPDKTGTITIGAGASGADFVITIVDTGCGIPSELKERVFEPFFTTKPVGEGTGLGLSIAYSIMKKHAGSLELSDAPGRGTQATLRIPLQMPTAD